MSENVNKETEAEGEAKAEVNLLWTPFEALIYHTADFHPFALSDVAIYVIVCVDFYQLFGRGVWGTMWRTFLCLLFL